MPKQEIVLDDVSDPALKSLLQEIDTDESGTIDLKEIKTAMENKKLLDNRLNLLQKRMLVLGCISIAVIVGLVFAVVYLAKDTKVKSGALTDMDGVPLKVKNADVRNRDDGTMVDSESGKDLKVATKAYSYNMLDIVRDVPKEENVDIQNILLHNNKLNITMSLDVQGVYRHWSEDAVYGCILTASSIEALAFSAPYDENAEPALTTIAREDCETGVWSDSVKLGARDLRKEPKNRKEWDAANTHVVVKGEKYDYDPTNKCMKYKCDDGTPKSGCLQPIALRDPIVPDYCTACNSGYWMAERFYNIYHNELFFFYTCPHYYCDEYYVDSADHDECLKHVEEQGLYNPYK